ncbi:MAG: GntR family transcriptional regulator [Corynebacteriales bacterium]|nr:GntR family transcriptional regulator [Mycobacteriales bacterium]
MPAHDTHAEPKYYQVKKKLLNDIAGLKPGHAIAPERELAEQFRTSRTTVRQALTELVVQGLLERAQGRGTFVANPKTTQTLQLNHPLDDIQANDIFPTSTLLTLDIEHADSEVSLRLELRGGARVVRIEKLRLTSGEPMAIETAYVPASRFPYLKRHLKQHKSLYCALREHYGITLSQAEETIETVLCPPREAMLLHTEVGAPMLLLSRRSYADDGTPVEFARSLYRGDRYKFATKHTRPN